MKTTLSRPGHADPRRPNRRTVFIDGPVGKVEVSAPRTTSLTPAAYGRKAEKEAVKALRKQGYFVTLSHMSKGAADLTATNGDRTLLVQVKSTTKTGKDFTASCFNQGVREIAELPCGPEVERMVFGFVKGSGHVVTINLLSNGAVVVNGKAPYMTLVQEALKRRRKV